MVTNTDSPLDEAERQADAPADELIREFHAHFEEYAEVHPGHAEKKRAIFEAWAIQKIPIHMQTLTFAAAQMGRRGGSAKSARKAVSSIANGRRGGRPLKNREIVARIPKDYKPEPVEWGKPVEREVW